jgi:transcriptional regulator of acetoin/glycerol metabolism
VLALSYAVVVETLGSTLSAEQLAPDQGGAHLTLSVALCADRPLQSGVRYPIDADEVLLGRGAERTSARAAAGGKTVLTLRFDDPRMSTTHARLVRRGRAWSLVDQGSKNGSRRNGEAVEQAAIGDGDVLELGSTFFVVRALGEAGPGIASPAPPAPLGIPTLHLGLGAALDRLAKVAPSLVSVVVTGESGTGKEVLARAIHRASGRTGRFQAVNCGALPATLVEAELFGCKRGAFSGAIADREGIVRSADGGTLLLDEIGDLPLASQAALLRVLQEHEVMPVGSTRAIPVDVRFVAATHRDLRALVGSGAFREDLLARLSGFHLQLPPLRERREDLGLLVGELLRRFAPGRARDVSLSRRAARALFAYDWPQNVRELEKCLEAALVFAGDSAIEPEHFPTALSGPVAGAGRSRDIALPRDASPEDQARRAELVRLLRSHRGNLSAVARELGKARYQVQRWMKRYALRPEDYR